MEGHFGEFDVISRRTLSLPNEVAFPAGGISSTGKWRFIAGVGVMRSADGSIVMAMFNFPVVYSVPMKP